METLSTSAAIMSGSVRTVNIPTGSNRKDSAACCNMWMCLGLFEASYGHIAFEYLSTFYLQHHPNVAEYTIHGAYRIGKYILPGILLCQVWKKDEIILLRVIPTVTFMQFTQYLMSEICKYTSQQSFFNIFLTVQCLWWNSCQHGSSHLRLTKRQNTG